MGTPARIIENMPAALSIAGSDSGGGAGIQADLKVFMALGCHGMTALTALTAQSTVGVFGIHEVPPGFVTAQIDAVAQDIEVGAAKTGMLFSSSVIEAVAAAAEVHRLTPLVVDPVFVSKHGDRLLAEDAVEALRTRLIPLAALVTPNLFEAEGLAGASISSLDDMKECARALHLLGPSAVLVKGGHLDDTGFATDVFYDGAVLEEITGPRYDSPHTHGTGCALSAAATARLAHGDSVVDAVRYAKEFVSGAIYRGLRIGRGFGPVNPAWSLLAEEADTPR